MKTNKENGENLYLCRCVRWDWYDNSTIKIFDAFNNTLMHLDEWQTMIFYMADGSTNLESIIGSYLSRRGQLTEHEFIQKLRSTRDNLVHELHVIELSENKKCLEAVYELPASHSD